MKEEEKDREFNASITTIATATATTTTSSSSCQFDVSALNVDDDEEADDDVGLRTCYDRESEESNLICCISQQNNTAIAVAAKKQSRPLSPISKSTKTNVRHPPPFFATRFTSSFTLPTLLAATTTPKTITISPTTTTPKPLIITHQLFRLLLVLLTLTHYHLPLVNAQLTQQSTLTLAPFKSDLPLRPRPPSTLAFPNATFLLPIPSTDAYWLGLVDAVKLQMEMLTRNGSLGGGGILEGVWVDLAVVVTKRPSDLSQALLRITRTPELNLVALTGAGGIGNYASVAVAESFGLPVCDGLDSTDVLSALEDHPLFFRTRPTIHDQLISLVEVIKYNKWSSFSLMYTATSEYSDNPRMEDILANTKIELRNHMEIPETQTWGEGCLDTLLTIKSSFSAVIAYFGDVESLQPCLEQARKLHMMPTDGYAWILDDFTTSAINITSVAREDGFWGLAATEGSGDLYTQFIKNWKDPSYGYRYPSVYVNPDPLPGYMFAGSCAHLLLAGFENEIKTVTQRQNTTVASAIQELACGPKKSIVVDSPTDFTFPNMNTVTGPVVFKSNSGDRNGSFTVKYVHSLGLVNVGTYATSLSLDASLLSSLGWVAPPDTIAPSKGINTLALAVGLSTGVLLIIAGAGLVLLFLRFRMNARKLQQLEESKEENSLRGTNSGSMSSPRIKIEGAGQKAIDLLSQLRSEYVEPDESDKKGRDKKSSKRGGLRPEDFDFLIETFTSGANSYLPNFNLVQHNGLTIDEETEAFVMGPMLASSAAPAPKMTHTDSSLERPDSRPVKRGGTKSSGYSGDGNNRDVAVDIDGHAHPVGSEASMAQQAPPKRQSQFVDPYASTFSEDGSFADDVGYTYKSHLELSAPAADISTLDTQNIQDYMDLWFSGWNMDMFELSEMSQGHALYFSGVWLSENLELLEPLRVPEDMFKRWLLTMEREYRPHPYHNSIHAADVLHAMNFLLFQSAHVSKYTDLEKFAALVAAIGHDIDHPGYTNQFLVKTRDAMAILYSDTSVNEFHHAAHVFTITQRIELNIFNHFSMEEYEDLRRIVVRLILSTDMGKHFEYVTKFKAKIASSGFAKLEQQENKMIVMEIAIKCGDLSNPTKQPELAGKWVDCIMEEFYRQGDRERELGIPVSQFMDRLNANVPKCQIGFIDILVAPLFDVWVTFNNTESRFRKFQKTISKNRAHWASAAASVPQARHTSQNSSRSQINQNRHESSKRSSRSMTEQEMARFKAERVPINMLPPLPSRLLLESENQLQVES